MLIYRPSLKTAFDEKFGQSSAQYVYDHKKDKYASVPKPSKQATKNYDLREPSELFSRERSLTAHPGQRANSGALQCVVSRPVHGRRL